MANMQEMVRLSIWVGPHERLQKSFLILEEKPVCLRLCVFSRNIW